MSATCFMEPAFSCMHPSADRGEHQVYFLANAPHVLRTLGHLVSKVIFVLNDVVAKSDLPTDHARYNFTNGTDQMCQNAKLSRGIHFTIYSVFMALVNEFSRAGI